MLIRGATRGDGVRGEDVTPNVRAIQCDPAAPRAVPRPDGSKSAARSICRAPSFARINAEREAEGEPLFMNPRNAAAGTMRNLDPRLVRRRRLWAPTPTRSLRRPSRPAADPLRDARGDARLGAAGRAALPALRRHRRGDRVLPRVGRQRRELQFDTDGVVVEAGRSGASRALGLHRQVPALGHRVQVPRRAGQTKLLDIDVNVGRTGANTPYAVLEPVFVAGSTDLDGDAAQRRGHPAQGFPRRRHGRASRRRATSFRASSSRCSRSAPPIRCLG